MLLSNDAIFLLYFQKFILHRLFDKIFLTVKLVNEYLKKNSKRDVKIWTMKYWKWPLQKKLFTHGCFFLLYLQHSYPYEPPKKATYCSRTQWIWYSILKPFFILTLKVWNPKGHVSSYTAKYLVFWFFDNKRSKR